ncbi:MAG: class A beta-lactamase, subclass A2 [Bacteroidetes bacterium]|nr:MAG: class A beta-lactamase, subclass A2 [Bacteroidota bacterium]
MKKCILCAVCLVFAAYLPLGAQSTHDLRESINQIISSKNALTGVAIAGHDGKDTLSLNGNLQFPMQSVFKFHIALAMMAEIDKGNFSPEQKVRIKKDDLLPGLYSPLRDKHPEGANLTIAELSKYAVALSDNVASDALLRLLGGPLRVECFFADNGFADISIKINEEEMQSNWDLQFKNWTTPMASNQILRAFFENTDHLLSQASHEFIWRIMGETITGRNRIRGKLPHSTDVAHKTGWSGTHKTSGITAAVNNIGIVFLPDDSHFYISVFVTDSKEDFQTNEQIIADIAKAAWDYFTQSE